jgi:hypothetical protein
MEKVENFVEVDQGAAVGSAGIPRHVIPTQHYPATACNRLLYDRKSAAKQLSISIRSLDYFLAAGRFKTRRIGRKVLIPHGELLRFAASDHWQPVNSAL